MTRRAWLGVLLVVAGCATPPRDHLRLFHQDATGTLWGGTCEGKMVVRVEKPVPTSPPRR